MKISKYYSAHFLPLDNLGSVAQHWVLVGDVSVPVLNDGLFHFEGDLGKSTYMTTALGKGGSEDYREGKEVKEGA